MTVFQLPKKLCQEIAALMAKFWWSFKKDENKIQWRSWAKLGVAKASGGLGFRELVSFNKALLAKQCWRMLTNSQSLAAKILKEKYFRHSAILASKLGFRPSAIWRSLWGSLDLLKEGLVWRVGDGESINIWRDKWIPKQSTFRIQTPRTVLADEAKVKELIDGVTKTWKTDLVKGIFNEEEAALVCSLPISSSGLPDKLIWAYTKNGQFDVKSAYHLELCRKNREKGEVSKAGTEIWKKLWQLNVPGVVKMFLWKALNNCLPTKFNLFCRKIVKDYYCPICKLQKETVSHALWSCGGAMDVWAENRSPVQKWASTEKDIQELWAEWSYKLEREELELMAVVLRRIWSRRNSFVFENKFEGPDVIFRQATDLLLQFQEAQQVKHRSQRERPQTRELCRWQAPTEGQVKVNWDAALKVNEGRMGIGAVMRDEHGELLVSLCAQKRIVTSPLVAEFQALWRAMQLCADLNLSKVVFEGDALSVIKAVNETGASWEWHGQLVEDIRGILKNRSNWSVTHTYRECNSVAHFLAKSSLLVNEETIWIEEGPIGIQYYVQKDKVVTVEDE